MNNSRSILTVGGLAGLMFILTCLFTVYETERGIILRLGKLQMADGENPVVLMPGLHWKLPLLDSVRMFDTRIQTIEIKSSRIVTKEKKDVIVDVFVKWRINNFSEFFKRTGGNIGKAEQLIRQKIIDGVRAEFGLRTIQQVVSGERQELMEGMLKEANISASHLGVSIVDTRINRIDLPAEVRDAVYDRMRTERERIAGEHRARGQSKANIIRAQADAEITIMIAKAKEESSRVRGQGEAKAAEIYANAYNKDPKFYRFKRNLEALSSSFKDESDLLVLSPSGAFFEGFKNAQRDKK